MNEDRTSHYGRWVSRGVVECLRLLYLDLSLCLSLPLSTRTPDLFPGSCVVTPGLSRPRDESSNSFSPFYTKPSLPSPVSVLSSPLSKTPSVTVLHLLSVCLRSRPGSQSPPEIIPVPSWVLRGKT